MKKQSTNDGAAGEVNEAVGGSGNGDDRADYCKLLPENSGKLTLVSSLMLDDLQGDSSLEPGEVKTPPRVVANATCATTNSAHAHDEPHPHKLTPRSVEVLRKKTSKSMLSPKGETELQQSYVLAKSKSAVSATNDSHVEPSVNSVEDAKRNILAESVQGELTAVIKSATTNDADSESEGLYSSSDESAAGNKEKAPTGGGGGSNSLASISKSPTRRYSSDIVLPPPPPGAPNGSGGPTHLLPPPYPDAFLGYRHQPYGRGNRPDFHHHGGRGGFMPRMRGNPRFPGFRPPFFVNGPPRHHMLNPRHHTPPPARGHSPIKAPGLATHLFWTKAKPTLSYAFCAKSEERSCAKKPLEPHVVDLPANSEPMREKSNKSSRTPKKKQSKSSSHDHKSKHKRRPSRSSSEKSNKRNIEKIRESMKRRTENPKLETSLAAAHTQDDDKLSKKLLCSVLSEKDMHCNVAKKIKVEKLDNTDVDKNQITARPTQPTSTTLLDPMAGKIKVEIDTEPKVATPDTILLTAAKHVSQCASDASAKETIAEKESTAVFDMFAESPTHNRSAKVSEIEKQQQHNKSLVQKGHTAVNEKRENVANASDVKEPLGDAKQIATLELSKSISISRKTTLQQAIETQKKRIDELLQDDDLDMRAIEATKKKLLWSTTATTTQSSRSGRSTAPEGAERAQRREEEPMVHKHHHNPFKRNSLSRDRSHTHASDAAAKHRSRTNSRDREERGKYSKERGRSERRNSSSARRSRSKATAGGSSHSLNRRSRSGGRDARKSPATRRRDSKERGKSLRSATPPMPPTTARQQKSSSCEGKRGYGSERSRGDDGTSKRRESAKLPHPTTKTHCDGGDDEGNSNEAGGDRDAVAAHRVADHDSSGRSGGQRRKSTHGADASSRRRESAKVSRTAVKIQYDSEDDEDHTTEAPWAAKGAVSHRAAECTNTTKAGARRRKGDGSGGDKNGSPDTDDYLDNWENDANDSDMNANAVSGDTSTPRIISKSSAKYEEDVLGDSFVARYVNPSPPMELQKARLKSAERETTTTPKVHGAREQQRASCRRGSGATATPPPATTTATKAMQRELFGMQEIYDQFIRSVEESGVNVEPTKSEEASNNGTAPQATTKSKPKQSHRQQRRQTVDGSSTTSSSSSSSSSTSSSSSSSASESSSNTSSSSSSTTASSDSEDSNDGLSVKQRIPSTDPWYQLVAAQSGATACTGVNTEDTMAVRSACHTPPIRSTELQASGSCTTPCTPPNPPPITKTKSTDEECPGASVVTPPRPAASSKGTVKVKSDAVKDFKKLKSLEANLARIQLMRENYDSVDEISEELLKMERLFLQEKNLILQKYAAKETPPSRQSVPVTPPPRSHTAGATTPSTPTGQFIPSLQQGALETPPTTASQFSVGTPPPPATPDAANRIFDANREAIKLTISPLKLSRTPAIFEQLKSSEKLSTPVSATVEDEPDDFTEKLVKPAKEIAIVKPMMESKEHRSSQQQRSRHSPTSGGRTSRSTSRLRYSPQRRGHARSLSVSPLRSSGANSRRAPSPHRRARVRNVLRRSRSRSRSPSRQSGNGRRGDFSPPSHRRRRGGASRKGPVMRGYHRGGERDSRSRSPRPHSPRSPPPTSVRRSYSRDRYSRSPLPFKPPSPPLRHSLSPPDSQRGAASSSLRRRSRSISRSRSPRPPRSPRSPLPGGRYHDGRRRRSYDRRSLSPLQSYYAGEVMAGARPPPPGSSAYSYYNHHLSPNRISLDARINIVLNGSHGGQEEHAGSPYEAYSNYSQYGGAGAYMNMPPHPHPALQHSQPPPADLGAYFGANQYVPPPTMQAPHHHHHAHHGHPPVYSNIPTISGGGNLGPAQNYYYNELSVPPPHHPHHHLHQQPPLVKELPKINSVAVQKGNVLEIVPTELTTSAIGGVDAAGVKRKPKIKPPKPISWKDEVKNRQVTSAALKLSRDGENARGILKPLERMDDNSVKKKEDGEHKTPLKTVKTVKKKVYFEDGIFPKYDSEDEDRKIIEDKIRRRFRKMKRRGLDVPCSDLLLADKSSDRENRVDPELEKLPPPGQPFGLPPLQLPQPIYLRPLSPTHMLYFHYDPSVHSMYVSPTDKPMQQRPGHAPKSSAPLAIGGSGSALSPLSTPSSGSKKDLNRSAIASSRSNSSSGIGDYGAPKLIPILQRHESVQHQQQPPPPPPQQYTVESPSCSPAMTKGTFHAIGTAAASSPLSPQLAVNQRQTSPIGFIGMRINNFVRLPPSPLIRGVPPTVPGVHTLPPHMAPMANVRHPSVYQHIPPPNASAEYTIAPPSTLPPTQPYHTYGTPPPPFYNGNGSAYSSGMPPRQQPPGYFLHQPPHTPPIAAVHSPVVEMVTSAPPLESAMSVSLASTTSFATITKTSDGNNKADQIQDNPQATVAMSVDG